MPSPSPTPKPKLKLAIYWGAACGGCCVSVLDTHEKLLDIVAAADLVFWPIAMDIKYKDVNGDGIINDYDKVPLDYSSSPQIQYGFATEFNYKQWNLSILFEGVSRVKYFSGGRGYYPFDGREVGNILDVVAADHWTSRDISGTAATENPNAKFPRLTYGGNANNNRASTYWLNDASYLRLKNVQLSYTMDGALMKKVGIKSTTFSIIGENLHVWDKVKIVDPEQASSNGARYPKQRVITLQMNMQF